MDFLELAKKRFSSRRFTEQVVERNKLEKILEAAHVAPSANNYQAYELIVVQTKEGLDKIDKAGLIYGAKTAIIICEDKSKAWINPYNGRRLISHDATIATDHMMLEATDLGIGSVWICCFDPAIIKREFKLPENLEAINILALGYSSENISSSDRHDRVRKSLDELVIYEGI
ncbi:MAG: nitroreductase family protein [Clostridium butyricum]|nr:nitroreductase family protein [Clostridium butyricum]